MKRVRVRILCFKDPKVSCPEKLRHCLGLVQVCAGRALVRARSGVPRKGLPDNPSHCSLHWASCVISHSVGVSICWHSLVLSFLLACLVREQEGMVAFVFCSQPFCNLLGTRDSFIPLSTVMLQPLAQGCSWPHDLKNISPFSVTTLKYLEAGTFISKRDLFSL